MGKSKKRSVVKPALSGALVDSLVGESDRGCVLMAHAFLDEQVKALITEHLQNMRNIPKNAVELLIPTGWGAFHKRVQIAIALGLLPKEAEGIMNELAELRNDFAHLSHVNELSLDDVEPFLKQLKTIDRKLEMPRYSRGAVNSGKTRKHSAVRSQFMGGVVFLWLELETKLFFFRGLSGSNRVPDLRLPDRITRRK
jgi:hypothetical protein